MARLSIRHILLTGLVNPVVALLVLFLYWRGGHTGLARAFGTVWLLLLSLCLNFISCEWGDTHGWWWLLSPIAALVLLLVTARKLRIPRKAITGIVSLWILWLFILNPGISWVQDYNDGGVVAAAPVMAAPAVAAPAALPARQVCGAPTTLRHGDVNADEQSLQFSWDAPTDGDATATIYRLYFREVYATGTHSSDFIVNGNPFRVTDSGALVGDDSQRHTAKTYRNVNFVPNAKEEGRALQFWVIAFCEPNSGSRDRGFSGQSEPSNIVEYNVPVGLAPASLRVPKCDAPTNLHHGEFDADNRSLTLIWDPPTDGELVAGIAYVHNARWVRPDGTYSEWVDMPGRFNRNELGIFHVRLSASAEGRTNQFHIVARCGERGGVRSEPSNIVEFNVPSP